MSTGTVTVARTIVCPLESSRRKRNYVQRAVEEYQACLSTMADMMPSVDVAHWQAQDTTVSRVAKRECDTSNLYAHDRNDAAYKVAEAFGSRVSNGHSGDYPQFGNGDYVRCCSCCTGLGDSNRVRLVSNERGVGLYARLLKGTDGVWFHVNGGQYQDEPLQEIVEGYRSLGNVELHVGESGVDAHITYTTDVDVPSPANTPRYLGVDLGVRNLYTMTVLGRGGDVSGVHVESGDEQRHHRERLAQAQEQRQQSGVKHRATGVSDRQRYTDQVMHNASQTIVDHAADHAPCTVVVEDLTGYRTSADDAIHDWPYGSLLEKVAYKAEAARVPVVTVDPAGTSQMCRCCGDRDPQYRDGDEFQCGSCAYEVHADVNAAINIARRGREQVR